MPLVVDAGPAGLAVSEVDVAFVSVTLCAPGTTTCQTLDHIAVDTGSTGLRVVSGALNPSVASALAQQRGASGDQLAECIRFADGSFTWGPVKIADVAMAGESAASVAVQVIGDPAFAVPPAACTGTPQQTVGDLGANGILGIGNFLQDCGSYCSSQAANGIYFGCSSAGCASVAVPLAQQVVHPVSRFAQDNNGVLIEFPAISSSGAASASGTLVFGIGTQSNNALGNAQVYGVDPLYGQFTVLYQSASLADSFVDSGSNAYFLPAVLNNQVCPANDPIAGGYLCPTSTLNLSLTVVGANGASGIAGISVANADTLLANAAITALNNLGAPNTDPQGVVFGLPFFFGRSVFTAIEGAGTPKGAGPYVAF